MAAPAAPAATTARRPVDLRSVTLGSDFLGDWQRLNREATIPHCVERMETTGVLDNFRRLAGESDAPFRGPLFADSDLYKTLEAIGWEAVRGEIAEFQDFADEAIRLIAAVQQPDGYVNTYYQGPHAGERFTDLPQGHELYCLGHLVQAAIAWAHAGRTDLLDIALRYVELVHETFGQGARDDIDGHPEIETALVELSRLTGDGRHRELARRMVELRGHRTIGEGQFGGAYYQDQVPVRQAREVTGHAVRQLYLLAGVADLQLDDPDAGYADALDALWRSEHEHKLYITGGVGSRHRGEAFGDPYELPADRAYSETCAAIANLHWNWRMLLLHGDARYADEMERGLYNAIAVSTAIDGRSFFYSNPLQLRAGHSHEEDAPSARLDWYDCACCPPNLARLLASIGGYLVTRSDDAVQFQLYADGVYDLGGDLRATVRTGYPWQGAVRIEISRPSAETTELRIPGWAAGARLTVDGVEAPSPAPGYAAVAPGASVIELELPIEAVAQSAHPWVDAVRGSLAIRRGPVYYALESADLPRDVAVEDVVIPAAPRIEEAGWDAGLGVPTLRIPGAARRPAAAVLYAEPTPAAGADLGAVTVIPYFRWANRSQGAMRVWMPTS
ncbi:glycoside hydrolase family 127 protein [Leifsonia shinshuensis]|uniref:Glycoside hydrolase family 127 protein n=1 Tax=Leifsonia shinshuensis TaxID=150026 RepID=A0A7G6YH00_9MICO|nr:glycoside hydrolase family 127 protein [Leifsonia shinshuensis]